MDKADYLTNKASTSSTQDTPMRLPCVFQTHRGHIDTKYCMAVLGSIPELGSWDRLYPIVARSQGGGVWRLRVDLPPDVVMEYKWVVYNKCEYQIVEYEPGDNRKLCIGDKPVMVEDFDDAVQKITHISGDKVERLMSELEVRNTNAEMKNTAVKYMPSGSGPFQYDEALVQMVKELNPRMYVPDEYKTGILKKGLTSERYENASHLDGEICNNVKKPGFDNSPMKQKMSDYGLEISLVGVEKDARETSVDGAASEKNMEEVDEGVRDNAKGFVRKHKNRIVKVGLFAGVAVSAILLYKRLL